MYADRLDNLPPYLFARIDEMKEAKIRSGVDVIDLGVGDPDLPTPPHIVEALCTAARDPATHHYPSYLGLSTYREAVATWYKNRFGVTADPKSEIITLIGSKEGIAHVPEAFVNPGDIVLATDPGYPVYKTSTLFAEGICHPLPLTGENNFLPDLEAIPKDILKKTKLLFFGYPNNPTSAVAPMKLFDEVVEFAREHSIVAVHDNAYSEITFDGYVAPSFLQADGASEVGIEMHSLSKTYNMTGWRLGMAVGNKDIVAGLGRVKTNIDSGAFDAVQLAGVTALTGPQDCVADACRIYQERRDVLVKGLKSLGYDVSAPKATFYVWMKVDDSMKFSARLLDEAGIVATPGIGFGAGGEGYVRFAITRSVERITEAVARMEAMSR
ncbi:MAG: LL-diaminopimelate aminotransferase apoenzyme [Methanomicrobiales archaeon 53_19]|jgi:LL-diaminopimelate aminotransferase|uniref:LL-diaminopimelate aminotransferase n=1 Tax=Methanocalculus sp. TaxID=2004547 RepID=UPI00074B0229|nr:LL-diaminopimelate aminotransferase [Methanocalculus sp.]KUK70616.1 MAG: LL-diaminopimelate aminotransferase apoenzyme [Methanocalculus sp. 52_23]KUL03506.1 MAG: LL-diaminopimelate aminotransferase apoenzyme [Methanomicrobiales archaeon 53_19]HIJ06726.1 LL-diaminopimelate aminotransferase [Methanocalculus sp.]